MFVSAKVHQIALQELATERGRREELSRRCESQQASMEFLAGRVNQLERERAILFRQLTSLEIPTPTLRPMPSAVPDNPAAVLSALDAVGLFQDGPRHADPKRPWNAEGSVNYGDE